MTCSYIMARPYNDFVIFPKSIYHLIFILMDDCNLFRLGLPFCRGSCVIVMMPILDECYQFRLMI